MNNLILENGYNTDYIYSLIIALFYTPSDSTNKLINSDTNNGNTYYVQEYIKSKFIYPIHRNMSIESSIVNKFRNFIYNCGWNKDNDKIIIDKGEIDKFYTFIVSNLMEYMIQIVNVDLDNNTLTNNKYDMIRIEESHLNNTDNIKIMSLTTIVSNWIKDKITDKNYSYKFENIPFIIPIYLDIRDSETGLNKKYINIMEGISFEDNGDRIQKMFVWEIHSMICQTESGDYYAVTIDNNESFMGFSDKKIPSNWKIDMSDLVSAKKIMSEVRFIFYRLF
jgi:hypothetical protein